MKILYIVILLISVQSEGKSVDPFHWNREITLSAKFHLQWNNLDPKWITMEISGSGSGYIALGFSANGGMRGSDIVMGWVDSNGKPHLKDLHGVGNVMPIEDAENNYELLGGEERDGRTVIRFRRKWDTCDPQDFPLTDDTMRLIWAFSDEDPICTENGTFVANYHLSDRGGQSTFLKAEPDSFPKENKNGEILDSDIKAFDVFQTNNTINGDPTVLRCKIFRFPRLDRKHQVIGFKPIVDKRTAKYVHHMVIFQCIVPSTEGIADQMLAEHLDKSSSTCYPGFPPVWQKYCSNYLWAVGKEGDMIPEESGIPLGDEHDGLTYLSFDIHYDNPMRETFTDSSGIRIYYTDKLRELDGASLIVGHRYSFFHIVPPQMESFKTRAFCSSECTAIGLPEDGVTITHALLHAHNAARKLILRHIRQGIELPPLAEDKFYDTNYEQSRHLKPHQKFLPGDELIMECTYDTMDKQNLTFAGPSLDDEMCVGALYYFPKSKLWDCKSQPEFYSFLNSIGIEEVSGDGLKTMGVPFNPTPDQLYNPVDDIFMTLASPEALYGNLFKNVTITKPFKLSGRNMWEYLESFEWNKDNSTLARVTEDKWTNGQHYMYCGGDGKARIPVQNHICTPPKISKKYEAIVRPECQQ